MEGPGSPNAAPTNPPVGKVLYSSFEPQSLFRGIECKALPGKFAEPLSPFPTIQLSVLIYPPFLCVMSRTWLYNTTSRTPFSPLPSALIKTAHL